jgi:hypothetical protein
MWLLECPAEQDKTRQDKARQDITRQEKTKQRQMKTKQDKTRITEDEDNTRTQDRVEGYSYIMVRLESPFLNLPLKAYTRKDTVRQKKEEGRKLTLTLTLILNPQPKPSPRPHQTLTTNPN